jgi:pyrroloquinoline quinone biosynthesis protein B
MYILHSRRALLALFLAGCFCLACKQRSQVPQAVDSSETTSLVELEILGITQDAGSPQMYCRRDCCKPLWGKPDSHTAVVSLGLTDRQYRQQFLFEATPDIREQWKSLSNRLSPALDQPSGIFLTHAHMGHYMGLLHLGREAMGAQKVLVYGMPRMTQFLSSQGPWDQLVRLKNIQLSTLQADSVQKLNPQLEVIPLQVPHRDEYSETAGFLIQGPQKSALFIPDIDKWHVWETDLTELIKQVDYAFLDATFFDVDELPGRNMDEIPHPFVLETLETVKDLPLKERQKIHLIHFNHTNPLLHPDRPANSAAIHTVKEAGVNLARIGQRFAL